MNALVVLNAGVEALVASITPQAVNTVHLMLRMWWNLCMSCIIENLLRRASQELFQTLLVQNLAFNQTSNFLDALASLFET